jgi:hypothetical protein
MITLDSSLKVYLDGFPAAPLAPGQEVHLSARSDGDQAGIQAISLRMSHPGQARASQQLEQATAAGATLDYAMSQAAGPRSASVRITGVTRQGYAFERTYERSLLVAEPGLAGLRAVFPNWPAAPAGQ